MHTHATRRIKLNIRRDMHLLPTQSLRTRSLAELRPYPTGGPRLPIAVVGGGVAGLTAALQLSRRLPPDRRIILYEAQQRLGGWIESDVVEFEGRQSGAGSVVLEGGPRSIRPKGLSGWTMVELIHSLGLMDRLIIVPSTASSARNRFLSFRGRLNRLPSSLTSALQALFTLPVLRSLFPSIIPALILEPFRPSRFQRPASESKEEVERQRAREHLLDESVESFMRRRLGNEFGGRLTNNILSAVIHGIYACDARSLSVRSALPFLWETEQKHGSLLRALLPAKWNRRFRSPHALQMSKTNADNAEIKRIKDLIGPQYSKALDSASVYSFKFGVGEITRSIREELLRRPNVELRVGEPVKAIRYDDSGTSIVTSASASERVSRVVSSLPATALATLLDDSYASPTLQALLRYNPSTTVGVVNFAIPAGLARAVAPECLFLNKRAHHVTGDGAFGFLIPRCESQGLEAGGRKEEPTNPEGVLGVVFDSDAVAGQDQADGGVTKLTVMVGGPHFTQPMSAKAKSGGSASAAPLPSQQEILRRAVSALDRHLAIPVSLSTHEETVARARLQRHCIPTYLPGHFSRMLQLHSELQRLDQITVAGASYIGVSLNDVVRSAKATADNIVEAEAQGKLGGVTGLESFVENARGPMANAATSLPLQSFPADHAQRRSYSTASMIQRHNTPRSRKLESPVAKLQAAHCYYSSHVDMESREPLQASTMATLPAFLSSKPSEPLRFIYFDIFDTLVRPKEPPGLQYARLANRSFGLPTHYARATALFPQAFKEMQAAYPNYGKGTSEVPTPDVWWGKVIDRVLLGAGEASDPTAPKPSGIRRRASVRRRFGENVNYEDFYWSVRRMLVARCIQLFRNNEGYEPIEGSRRLLLWIKEKNRKRVERGLPSVAVGFASNSDPGIRGACMAMGLNTSAFCLSYDVGLSKPDGGFFAEAMKKARGASAGQILFIGNSVEEDAIPAARAGMRSILLLQKPASPAPLKPPQEGVLAKRSKVARDALFDQYESNKAARRQLLREEEQKWLQRVASIEAVGRSTPFDIAHEFAHVKERLNQIWQEEECQVTIDQGGRRGAGPDGVVK